MEMTAQPAQLLLTNLLPTLRLARRAWWPLTVALREDAHVDINMLAERLKPVVDETMQPVSIGLGLAPLPQPERED